MQETKWLKPSISVSRIGDSASVQAATRSERREALYGFLRSGVVATSMYTRKVATRAKPQGVVRDDQPDAREGQAGALGGGEVRSTAELDAGGGGTPVETGARRGEGPGDWATYPIYAREA